MSSGGNIANWANIRRRIVERDQHVCRMRGCDSQESLNVHHIDYERSNNDDSNLITLCRTCHRQIHLEGYKPYLYEDWPTPWGDVPQEFYFD